jgi:GGDEF domain-containing protein
MAKTPAEEMLPNSHISEASDDHVIDSRIETQYLSLLNAEARLHAEGVPPEDLAIMSMTKKVIENTRESVTDPMTGLMNRKGMELWLKRNNPEAVGILFADGRKFKEINNTYGHETGDKVIRWTGRQLADKFRIGEPEETVREQRAYPKARDAVGIVRWGGDEFMVAMDLSDVQLEKREAALRSGQERLDNLGYYTDDETGLSLPISIRSVGTIGYAQENKSLEDYYKELDPKLIALKNQENIE